MNIGIDIDDVLAVFKYEWVKFFNKKMKTSYRTNDIISHNLVKSFKTDLNTVNNLVLEFYQTREFDHLPPYPNSRQIINELNKKHSLFVITSRPITISDITNRWIDKYFKNIFEQVLSSNQFNPDNDLPTKKKSELCQEYEIEVFIDDAPQYIEDTARSGINTLMFSQPWNKHHKDLEVLENVKRVNNWKEIGDFFFKL